ncbi:MAG: molybdopterin cofactor-binding domain-containing protein, partial [Chloroflexota bacterium]
MKTTINQKAVEIDVKPTDAAVDVIRDQVGLTGTKRVCGVGVCGACTVLVEGNPVCSCLLPAGRLANKEIITVEGHANLTTGELHPVQKAMMAHDGLQCGYCTPGFVNAGIAFYETWRKANGKSRPSRDTIASALAGNLCRCGAYQGIYAALQAACEGAYDHVPTAKVKAHRVEAIEKVTGRAKYTTDIKVKGSLHGAILRSIHPFARIRSIDFSKALAIDGVEAVIDVLTDSERTARFVGTPLAAVAARDLKTAKAAISAIEVDYEVFKAVVNMEASMGANSATAERSFRKHIKGGLPGPTRWRGNVRSELISLTSNRQFRANRRLRRARASGDAYMLDNSFKTGSHAHTPLEPHGSLAYWEGDKLTLYTSTQSINQVRDAMMKRYDLPREKVDVICNHIGGGFGAKGGEYPEIGMATDLAKEAGKPVRLILEREEVIAYSGHREESRINVGILSNKEADLNALQYEAYESGGHAIEGNSAAIAGAYYTNAPMTLKGHAVATHTPPARAFRGPGGINGAFALEQTVDEMAYTIGIDPLDLRRKWDVHPQDQQLFDYLEEVPAWQARDKVAADKGRYKRGVGLALGHWMHLYMPTAQVRVTAGSNGISVECGIQDIGQGSRTVLGTAAAEAFGLPVDQINIKTGRATDLPSPS